MIRTLLILPFLLPMTYFDIKNRRVPIESTTLFIIYSIFCSLFLGFEGLELSVAISLVFFNIYLLFLHKKGIGGADVLVIIGFLFLFSFPITLMIFLTAVLFSYIYILITKDKNVPYILPLTLAALLIDSFNSI